MDKKTKQPDKSKDRGDLRKMTPKKQQEENIRAKIPFADRGDAVIIPKPNKLKDNEFESKRVRKTTKFKNISNATVGNDKSTVKAVQKQAMSHLDIRKLIRERYTMRRAAIQATIVNTNEAITNKGVNYEITVNTKNIKPQEKTDTTVSRPKLLPELQPQLQLHKNQELKEKPRDTTTADVTTKKPDKETFNRNPEKELINRKPDRESSYRNSDKEPTAKRPDRETSYRKPERESSYRNQDKETTAKKPDRETTYRKPDIELINRKPEKESSYRNTDKETTAKKPDRETTYRKQDLESTYRKPEKALINRKSDKESNIRKPIIRTVTPKNTNKIYKAVTFGTYRDPKPLQMNIPNNAKPSKIIINNKVSKSTDTVTLKPRPRVTQKPDIRRKIIRKRIRKTGHDSPDSYKFRKNESPPTEVAKWAPSCVNRHTKPYYEAWVNTTLAAISKSSKKDKLFLEKRSIIQSFQRALEERAESPELIYEKLKDERYTGRIRVISRHRRL